MKLTYHRCGDYQLPDLTIPDEPVALGKYGRMRKTYSQQRNLCLPDFADAEPAQGIVQGQC